MKNEEWQEFKDDLLGSMDDDYEELRKKLDPVFNNKTKYVNGKLMKDCFKYIGNIIRSHHILRREQDNV